MSDKPKSGFEADDQWKKICFHPEHQPPMHLHIPQGQKYKHVCPECGAERDMRAIQVRC